MLFNSAYPIHPSDNVTKYTVYLHILLVEWLFKWSLTLFCYFILWLAKPGSKILCILFARVCFYKSSFFIPSFQHQHSSSCYLVVATAKIPKIWKHTPLDVYYSSIDKSQDREINHQWIIQPKLIDCPSGTFLNFVIPANLYRKFESKT